MTQGQFLSGVYQVWIQSFPSPKLVAIPWLKIPVYHTIFIFEESKSNDSGPFKQWVYSMPSSQVRKTLSRPHPSPAPKRKIHTPIGIHIFSLVVSAIWNANSHVQELNSGHRVHLLRWWPLPQEHLYEVNQVQNGTYF